MTWDTYCFGDGCAGWVSIYIEDRLFQLSKSTVASLSLDLQRRDASPRVLAVGRGSRCGYVCLSRFLHLKSAAPLKKHMIQNVTQTPI